MSLKLKVCGLRDDANFREVALLNLDFLGLIFISSSSRSIELEQAVRLAQIDRGKTLLTGLFQNQDSKFICEVVQEARLDCVQIYGEKTTAKELKSLLPQLKVLKAVTATSLLTAESKSVDYFLVDNEQGGSGVKFNWNLLSEYKGDTPLLIAGGIGPDDAYAVRKLVEENPMVHGVDVSSKFELSVCLKDAAKIKSFKDQLAY